MCLKHQKYPTFRSILLGLLLLGNFAHAAEFRLRPSHWATPVIGTGLDNLYMVDEGVYRSEQPDDEKFVELAKAGITEVLNLREHHSDEDDAKGSGLKLHHVPMRTWSISDQQIVQALRIIRDRKGPILVHCWHGSDRTGVVIATYRMVFEGWSKQQALDEMENGGFGYHESIFPGLRGLITNLDIDHIQKVLRPNNNSM